MQAADVPIPGVKPTECKLPASLKSLNESGISEVNVVTLGFEMLNSTGVPIPNPAPANITCLDNPVSRFINLKCNTDAPNIPAPAPKEMSGTIAQILLFAFGSQVSILGLQNCLIAGSVGISGGTGTGSIGRQGVNDGSQGAGSIGASQVSTVGSQGSGFSSSNASQVVTVGSQGTGSIGASQVSTVGSQGSDFSSSNCANDV